MRARIDCSQSRSWRPSFLSRRSGAAGLRPDRPEPSRRSISPATGCRSSAMDWRWRMVTPAKGDYAGIPMNAASKTVADAWDPAKDEAAGEQCKSYGAPAIMSVPGRLRITWQDDSTLKVETDAGQQTRLLKFGAPAGSGSQGAAQLAGDFRGAVADVGRWAAADAAAAGARGRRARARSRARRHAEGDDDQPARGLSAQERRAVQRQRRAHGVLGSDEAPGTTRCSR